VIAALPYLYEISLRRFAKRHQRNIDSGQLNLHLWRDGDNTYHLKGMWIDQRYTLLTGNNLNPRAFRLDLENALLIDDPKGEWLEPRAKELEEIFRTPRGSSVPGPGDAAGISGRSGQVPQAGESGAD
jgi:CDP-diacylglycerol--serine O-phosphatidyltransferase